MEIVGPVANGRRGYGQGRIVIKLGKMRVCHGEYIWGISWWYARSRSRDGHGNRQVHGMGRCRAVVTIGEDCKLGLALGNALIHVAICL